MSPRGILPILLLCGITAACNSSAEQPAAARDAEEAAASPAAPAPATPAPATPSPAAPPAQVATQPPAEAAPDPNLWYPRYDWALEVDGKPADEARFFVDTEGKKVLVVAERLPRAGVLTLPAKQVSSLDAKQVTLDAARDTARLAPEATLSPPAEYTVEGAQVVFYLGSNRLKITPKLPLEGPTTRDAILSHSPLYRRALQEYVPGAAEVAFLKSYARPVEIVVFFGTWCPHCKVLVPRFMKAMQEADNPRIQVSYVGVPRNFAQYDPARSRGVTGVPSFIFYSGGREFSRIPGEPADMTIEAAVVEILRAAGA
jgi:thiol-disulfide isomerase/thioredoxin